MITIVNLSFQQHDHCHVWCKNCWSFRTILVHLRFLIGAYVVHHQHSVFCNADHCLSMSSFWPHVCFSTIITIFYLLSRDYIFCLTYSKDSPCSVVSVSCFPFSFISVVIFIYKYIVYLVDLNVRRLDACYIKRPFMNDKPSQTCIKRLPLGQRKTGLLRQVTSYYWIFELLFFFILTISICFICFDNRSRRTKQWHGHEKCSSWLAFSNYSLWLSWVYETSLPCNYALRWENERSCIYVC